MRARLKSLHGTDVPDLARWVPPAPDDFAVSLVLGVGPLGLRGKEEFELLVVTPRWLLERHGRRGLVPGRGKLLVFEWDLEGLRAFLARKVEACTGRTWPEAISGPAEIRLLMPGSTRYAAPAVVASPRGPSPGGTAVFRRILLALLGLVVAAVAALAVFVASRQHLRFDAPYPEVAASSDGSG